MHTVRFLSVGAALALLLFASLMVYTTFARHSQSMSDTRLSFLITLAPVWAAALAAMWAWLHPAERQCPGE